MLAGIGRIFHRSAAEGLAAMESYTRSVGGNFCLSKSPTQTKDGISMRQTQDPLSISGNHWLVREPNGSCLREPSQVLDAVLAVRGIGEGEQRKAFLNPSLVQMQHPREFSNAVLASKEILAALHAKKSIVVFGDYDVDGIMATAIMWHMLRAIDPNANVRTYVPHRIEEGYGLKIEALTKLREEGADLVITVDCGVSAVEAAAHAAKVGLQHGSSSGSSGWEVAGGACDCASRGQEFLRSIGDSFGCRRGMESCVDAGGGALRE